MNPFNQSLEDFFRFKRVKVTKDDDFYVGYLERMNYNENNFILEGVDGHGVISIFNADSIRLDETPPGDPEIKTVEVNDLKESPYAVRDFDYESNSEYIKNVHQRQRIKQFPTAFKTNTGLQLIDGHKSKWVCEQANVQTHPVRVLNISEWDATVRFVFEHIPGPKNSYNNGYYSVVECIEVISRLYANWGDRIMDIPQIRYTINQLDLPLKKYLTLFDVGQPIDFSYHLFCDTLSAAKLHSRENSVRLEFDDGLISVGSTPETFTVTIDAIENSKDTPSETDSEADDETTEDEDTLSPLDHLLETMGETLISALCSTFNEPEPEPETEDVFNIKPTPSSRYAYQIDVNTDLFT